VAAGYVITQVTVMESSSGILHMREIQLVNMYTTGLGYIVQPVIMYVWCMVVYECCFAMVW